MRPRRRTAQFLTGPSGLPARSRARCLRGHAHRQRTPTARHRAGEGCARANHLAALATAHFNADDAFGNQYVHARRGLRCSASVFGDVLAARDRARTLVARTARTRRSRLQGDERPLRLVVRSRPGWAARGRAGCENFGDALGRWTAPRHRAAPMAAFISGRVRFVAPAGSIGRRIWDGGSLESRFARALATLSPRAPPAALSAAGNLWSRAHPRAGATSPRRRRPSLRSSWRARAASACCWWPSTARR